MLKKLAKRLLGRPPAKRWSNVLSEEQVSLDRCDLIGQICIGYRSYATSSVLREATIGRFCSIGRRCSIGAPKHDIDAFSTHPSQSTVMSPRTTIGNDVWIGDNVVILAGLTIGDGAVVAANAVVRKDVRPYEIVAGVPARVIRMRFDERTCVRLLASKWWTKGDVAAGAATIEDALELSLKAPILPEHLRVRS